MAAKYRQKIGLWFVKTTDSGPPTIRQYPLVSGTYYDGTVLRVSGTSGSAAIAAAAGTSLLGVSGSYVTTASSTSGTWPVYMLDDRNIFEGQMIATGGNLPQKRVGDMCDLAVSTANCRLQGTASTKVFSIWEVQPDAPATTTDSPVKYYVKSHRNVFANTKSDSTK